MCQFNIESEQLLNGFRQNTFTQCRYILFASKFGIINKIYFKSFTVLQDYWLYFYLLLIYALKFRYCHNIFVLVVIYCKTLRPVNSNSCSKLAFVSFVRIFITRVRNYSTHNKLSYVGMNSYLLNPKWKTIKNVFSEL